jgi:HK97 family phage portal protein
MANIFTRFFTSKQKEKRSYDSYDEWTNPVLGTLSFWNNNTYTTAKALKLSAVYRATDLISSSVASLPLLPYKYEGNWKYIDYSNSLYNILNVQPNMFMSSFTFKKMIVLNMLLNGNAFISIDKDKNGKVLSLTLLSSDDIQIIAVNGDIKYRSIATEKVYDKSQIIHILNYSQDGLNGISTLSYAATTLNIYYEQDNHAKNFWQSGANLSGILKPSVGVNMSKEKAVKAKSDFITALSSELGGKSGSIVVLDSALDYSPISISPKESQMLEAKAFSVIDVARFFGVPPSLLFDQNNKYSTNEQQQLDYLNNALLPVLEKIENEMFRKLYLQSMWDYSDLKFDVENLLRTDANTRADYLTKLFNIGGFSVNEVREKVNAQFPVTGGGKCFIQTNLQPVDALVVTSDKNNLDNKAK